VVVKPSPASPKKKATASPSKRQKRGAAVAASLEVHQPSSCSTDNVSSAAYNRLFLFLILKSLHNLYPAGFDAEVSFSWSSMRQNLGDC
jgi:hypothetical protein